MSATMNAPWVDFHTTPELKALIEQAATIYGMTVTEYVKVVLVEKSLEVIEHHETRVLSDRDRDIFLALLDAPTSPNEALRGAATDYKRAVKEGELIP